jgi:hypothetical protein
MASQALNSHELNEYLAHWQWLYEPHN